MKENKISVKTERVAFRDAELFGTEQEAREAGFGFYFRSHENSLGRDADVFTRHPIADNPYHTEFAVVLA